MVTHKPTRLLECQSDRRLTTPVSSLSSEVEPGSVLNLPKDNDIHGNFDAFSGDTIGVQLVDTLLTKAPT